MPETHPSNPIPERLARAVPARVPALVQLGRPEQTEVFVTAADDIEGCSADQLSSRLGIGSEPAFYVITFSVERIQGPLTSPIFRENQCFVGGGRTRGGAREFTIPNQSIPENATIREVRQ